MRQKNGYQAEESGTLGRRLSMRKGLEGQHLRSVCWVPHLIFREDRAGVEGHHIANLQMRGTGTERSQTFLRTQRHGGDRGG